MSSDLHKILEAAGVDPATLGPFASLVEALDAVVRARLEEGQRDSPPAAYTPEAAERAGLDPDAFYTADELAERWRMVYQSGKRKGQLNTNRVYEIPKELLPRRGPSGRALFWGLDVMLYEGTITRDQFDAVQAQRQPTVANQNPPAARVRSLRPRQHSR